MWKVEAFKDIKKDFNEDVNFHFGQTDCDKYDMSWRFLN